MLSQLDHLVSINCLSLLKILGTINAEEKSLTQQSILSLGPLIFKYLGSMKVVMFVLNLTLFDEKMNESPNYFFCFPM